MGTVVNYDCNMFKVQPTWGTLVNYVCIMFIVLVTAGKLYIITVTYV